MKTALLERKRRHVVEYVTSTQELLELLQRSTVEPDPDELALILERRERAIEDIRQLDRQLDVASEDEGSSTQAEEIVASSALRRALEQAVELDTAVQQATETWRSRVNKGLQGLAKGRKTLRGYATREMPRDTPFIDQAA